MIGPDSIGILTGIAGLITAMGAIYLSRRNRSGQVATTDADGLWDHMATELKRMEELFAVERGIERDARLLLRTDLADSEKRERECVEQQRRMEKELHDLRIEVGVLQAKVAAMTIQGEALAEAKIENAAFRAAALVKADAATTARDLPHAIVDVGGDLSELQIADPTIVRKDHHDA